MLQVHTSAVAVLKEHRGRPPRSSHADNEDDEREGAIATRECLDVCVCVCSVCGICERVYECKCVGGRGTGVRKCVRGS